MKKKYILLFVICLLIISTKSFATETEYGGIGCVFKKDGSKTYIIKVFPNTPAAKAMIQDSTQILEINGQSSKKLSAFNISINSCGGRVYSTLLKGQEREHILQPNILLPRY